jgi:hypothetical protein
MSLNEMQKNLLILYHGKTQTGELYEKLGIECERAEYSLDIRGYTDRLNYKDYEIESVFSYSQKAFLKNMETLMDFDLELKIQRIILEEL